MSFTRLLAAGRSIMGINKEPGPYRMNQESLLPKFPAQPRSAAIPGPVADLRMEPAAPETSSAASPSSRLGLRSRIGQFLAGTKTRLSRLAGRRVRTSSGIKPGGRVVQTELSLDGVTVVRNDLKDSEVDVAAVRNRPGSPGRKQKSAPGQPLGVVWNQLSARLLRQAVQDFNLAQKERGKVLTQAGDGGGGARGA